MLLFHAADSRTLRLVLISKESLDAVRVEVSGLASYSHATVLRLVAPTFGSEAGTTFVGRPVDLDESWKPYQAQRVQVNGGSFLLESPSASAAVGTFKKRGYW